MEQTVEGSIHQRRYDAVAAFIRMGEVEVETRVLGEDLTRFDDDSAMPAGNGSLVKLSNVTTVGAGMSPGQIERYAQERSITIISNLYQKPLAEAFRVARERQAAEQDEE